MKHIHVTCAIIERDGLVLAAQRSEGMSMPLKWEFPGGKIDPGESPEECLRRELLEEMSIQVGIEESLPASTHNYQKFAITLYPFICSLKTEEIVLHEHAALAWLPAGELHCLDWAEADLPVVDSYLVACGVQS
ncbi:(deoxy)nucleoside triphosphate pyrophosphohydrolase [Syntrophotalea acetylenica]|jgi:8-oxo-dGTP diphosphatase|uniref:8-oxo-dGTP diphosphatase n=1 Tax=Syntrophotalea acetylenica TaxID=29542 RepID=A0A1L3GEZ4_SYNAC|nr:(deoxy)nucleoside triphosphate pyrophosphohydrolase [Syntrophotalea acetylenica]APG24512.1 NUDIX hydrolase [Syntrophotalea acetylenica]APG45097.1 NUDIX hydrolase [Syntrophotalea acetylenica]